MIAAANGRLRQISDGPMGSTGSVPWTAFPGPHVQAGNLERSVPRSLHGPAFGCMRQALATHSVLLNSGPGSCPLRCQPRLPSKKVSAASGPRSSGRVSTSASHTSRFEGARRPRSRHRASRLPEKAASTRWNASPRTTVVINQHG